MTPRTSRRHASTPESSRGRSLGSQATLAAVGVYGAMMLSGCSHDVPGSPAPDPSVGHISASDLGPVVSDEISERLAAGGMPVTGVSCGEALPLLPGAASTCVISVGDDPVTNYSVRVRVDSIDADQQVHFAYDVLGIIRDSN